MYTGYLSLSGKHLVLWSSTRHARRRQGPEAPGVPGSPVVSLGFEDLIAGCGKVDVEAGARVRQ